MSNLTAQQHYENTRGSNSPENREKKALAMFGHKGESPKSKAIHKKISFASKLSKNINPPSQKEMDLEGFKIVAKRQMKGKKIYRP